MPRIIPIRDLRDTNKITEMCSDSPEPIFVTKNGYGEMVVMSMEAYEAGLAKLEAYNQIMAGRKQAEEGVLEDGPTIMTKLGEKYGLL